VIAVAAHAAGVADEQLPRQASGSGAIRLATVERRCQRNGRLLWFVLARLAVIANGIPGVQA
jgi:hypothetical protein